MRCARSAKHGVIGRKAVDAVVVAEASREGLAALFDDRCVGLGHLISPLVFAQGVPFRIRRERGERYSVARPRHEVSIEVELDEPADGAHRLFGIRDEVLEPHCRETSRLLAFGERKAVRVLPVLGRKP